MKNVLLFSAVVLLAWICPCGLCAQSCQAQSSCQKACMSSAKVDAKGAASTTAVAQPVSLTDLAQPGTPVATAHKVNVQKSGACNPANCDPSKCDVSKCDPTKCDLSKCTPKSQGAVPQRKTSI